jgi:cell division transport system permease protein
MKVKSSAASKVLARPKQRQRKWLTFVRMLRYGVNNISRNAWLTIAATAVMTITLLVVFMTLVARNVLLTTVSDIRNKVDVSIYVKSDTSNEDVQAIKSALQKLPSVNRVTYISPQEGQQIFAQQNKSNPSTLEALNEASQKIPGTFQINPIDINNTSELQHFTETNPIYKKDADPNQEPSFAGDRRDAIEKIGKWVKFAEQAGLIASIIFIAISSLIVFNTIRMAIFNRKDEIQMMKLIGADQSFIRGPFVVEAVVYGVIAALLATTLGIALLYASSAPLLSYGVAVKNTIDFVSHYIGLVLFGMILAGSIIGVISSLLATRRYLKI